MRTTATPRRKATKAELVQILLGKVNKWINEGHTPLEAVEMLTPRQYDFLIDQNVDFDGILLTEEQQKNSHEVRRRQRICKDGGYNKKYPQSKQELYNGICAYLEAQGATIIPREKPNYRDLDFTLNDTHYRIVLSNPRQ